MLRGVDEKLHMNFSKRGIGMGTATKKQFRVLALAVLLCILLAGCSDSAAPSPAASGSTGTKKAYVPHGEVEWTYQYSSDAALAEKVEENGA
jgi:ABC-type glycerol-3-phosphate transport system substrate-binding protein